MEIKVIGVLIIVFMQDIYEDKNFDVLKFSWK